jgi:hypothetical protein
VHGKPAGRGNLGEGQGHVRLHLLLYSTRLSPGWA